MASFKDQRIKGSRIRKIITESGFLPLLDLGAMRLWPEWRTIFSTKDLRQDAVAGITVAGIALPLSLAVALASSVKPEVGLVSAIIGSIVAAFFGGSAFSISGPAAAMAILVATIVQQQGITGLLWVGFFAGLFQVLAGMLRLSRLMQLIPVSVFSGFTAGIGAIILIGELPRALGLAAPEQSHVFDVITHLWSFLSESKPHALILSSLAFALSFGLPTRFPKLPAALIAVVLATALAELAGFSVDRAGVLPALIQWPGLPELRTGSMGAVLSSAAVLFALTSVESLRSSDAVDRIARAKRHDPDQELVGQGLANVAVALFGGIPIAGGMIRSALNVQAGARTRRAAIIQALVLLLAAYVFGFAIAQIPIPALAGVLLSLAIRMLHPKQFVEMWRASREDGVVHVVTFISIVALDLTMGVQAGIVVALAIASVRLGRARATVQVISKGGPAQILIEGSLTFASTPKIETVRRQLAQLQTGIGVIVDLSNVSAIDATGAGRFVEVLNETAKKGSKIAIVGANDFVKNVLVSLDQDQVVVGGLVESEADALSKVGMHARDRSVTRLRLGVAHFKRAVRPGYEKLFEKLSAGQSPHTLFITCSDSRIDPTLITATDPGELFLVRNVGNLVPPMGVDQTPAEGAALEFAVSVLGVTEIVICGHSECGAMKGVCSGAVFEKKTGEDLPSLQQWLSDLKELQPKPGENRTYDEVAQKNVLKQMANLYTYPLVKERVSAGALRIHGWFYDVKLSDLSEWDEKIREFVPMESKGIDANPEITSTAN